MPGIQSDGRLSGHELKREFRIEDPPVKCHLWFRMVLFAALVRLIGRIRSFFGLRFGSWEDIAVPFDCRHGNSGRSLDHEITQRHVIPLQRSQQAEYNQLSQRKPRFVSKIGPKLGGLPEVLIRVVDTGGVA